MPGQLPKAVKKERARQMIALGRKLSHDFHRRYEGSLLDVLWETATGADKHGLRWMGYTDNFIRVIATGPADLFNRISVTRLANARPDGLDGQIVR